MCDFGLKTQLFRLNKTKKSKNFFKKVFKISYIEDSIFDTFWYYEKFRNLVFRSIFSALTGLSWMRWTVLKSPRKRIFSLRCSCHNVALLLQILRVGFNNQAAITVTVWLQYFVKKGSKNSNILQVRSLKIRKTWAKISKSPKFQILDWEHWRLPSGFAHGQYFGPQGAKSKLQQISWSLGGVFSNSSPFSAVYYHIRINPAAHHW